MSMAWGLKQRSYLSTLSFVIFAGLMGCNEQPKTFVPGLTDAFVSDTGIALSTASAVYQADYVFVLDYSSSMRDKRDALLSKMGNFVDILRSEDIDYRIGFVYGSAHGLGRYGSLDEKLSNISSSFVAPFLDGSADGSLESSILDQVYCAGDPECLPPNTPVFLESAARTMEAEGSEFNRDGSQLVYVFVSDQDDEGDSVLSSGRTVGYYVNRLKAVKSHSSYVSARAYVAGGASCGVRSGDADGARLAAVAQQLDAIHSDTRGCVYDESASQLENLARNVTKPTDRFALGSRPRMGTITVRVNGVSNSDWSYVSATNEIVFSIAPPDSASIDISYEVAYTLSRTPKAGTIKVTVNGASVAENSSNGWSYVSGENRIQFHGSAQPGDGAKVLVSYEVQ
jgi:hypothetical protein